MLIFNSFEDEIELTLLIIIKEVSYLNKSILFYETLENHFLLSDIQIKEFQAMVFSELSFKVDKYFRTKQKLGFSKKTYRWPVIKIEGKVAIFPDKTIIQT